MKTQGQARAAFDGWEEKIIEYLQPRDKVTIGEIARNALLLDPRIGTASQRRISAVLEHLRWERERDGKARWWIHRRKRYERELREFNERKARHDARASTKSLEPGHN
jgi:hypothetical protein